MKLDDNWIRQFVFRRFPPGPGRGAALYENAGCGFLRSFPPPSRRRTATPPQSRDFGSLGIPAASAIVPSPSTMIALNKTSSLCCRM